MSIELKLALSLLATLLAPCLLAGVEWWKRRKANNRLTDAMLRRGFRKANNNGWVKP